MNGFHPALERNPLLSVFQTVPDPLVSEVLSRSGYDTILVDLQHGLGTTDSLVDLVRAADVAGGCTLVRVQSNSPENIGRALDRGAHGVIVPMVNSVDDARNAVSATRYPPEGERSFGSPRLALSQSLRSDTSAYSPPGGYRPFLAVMIETRAAVEALPEIVAVPGIDAVFIGPADLGLDLGSGTPVMMPGEGSEHDELIREAARVAGQAGVVAGIACAAATGIERWSAAGYTWFAVGADFGFLIEGATTTAAAVRTTLQERKAA